MKVFRAVHCIALTLFLVGCNGANLREIDDDAFLKHFAAQSRCQGYIDALLAPSTSALSKLSTRQEMRGWFDNHPQDEFAKVVLDVRLGALRDRPMDPAADADSDALVVRMANAIEKAAGYSESGCGAAVQDIVLDSFYRGVGGSRPAVNAWVNRNGRLGEFEQRYLLMATMLAPSVP